MSGVEFNTEFGRDPKAEVRVLGYKLCNPLYWRTFMVNGKERPSHCDTALTKIAAGIESEESHEYECSLSANFVY